MLYQCPRCSTLWYTPEGAKTCCPKLDRGKYITRRDSGEPETGQKEKQETKYSQRRETDDPQNLDY